MEQLLPQLLGLVMGILGGYALFMQVRKRYPGVNDFFDNLFGTHPKADEETVLSRQIPDDPLKHPDWQVRRDAVAELAESDGDDVLPALLTALNDNDLDVRETACAALVARGSEAVPDLITLLETGRMEARVEAAKALGAIGDRQALSHMLDALQNDDSVWVRAPIAEALGRMGGNGVVEALESALRHDEATVQEAAVRGLTHLDTRPARKILKQHGH